jgi:GNAT superfamily N-acetyltransferase
MTLDIECRDVFRLSDMSIILKGSRMSMTIIRATLEHLDLVVPLFDGYRQFYKAESDVDAAWRFLRERIELDESVIFVAMLDSRAVGFTQLYPIFSSVSMMRKWLLNDLFVAPDARGTGAGGALLEHARQYAAETGAKGLMLQTAVDNVTAQRVYEAHGWQRDDEFYVYEIRAKP